MGFRAAVSGIPRRRKWDSAPPQVGFRAAVSGIPRGRKWDSAPTYRPQVANKRVSVFAKITGIGAKEDKKDLQAARADYTAATLQAYLSRRARRVATGWHDGMPCCAVPCVQGKAGSGNGTV